MGHHTSKSGAAQRRLEQRQDEADARQERYDALSLEQKLAQQKPFGGKQYERLLAQVKS
jgi:hypothetical protein